SVASFFFSKPNLPPRSTIFPYTTLFRSHQIFSDKIVDIDEIIQSFGRKINRVILGFTPLKKENYEIAQLHEEDTTLFLKGIDPVIFEKEKWMFPTLSHA